jgi:hypothetical protein
MVYFDMFRYPLTKTEIFSFLDQAVDLKRLDDSLNKLLIAGKIFRLGEFYSLQNDMSLAARRKKGNQEAARLQVISQKIASLLYKFPYVRAVGISGSVSKNFADEQGDIDYFIITAANRLWIARTFLHVFKKLPFLKHRHDHYCMNYFIDEAQLVIEEKNIYTATELYTVIPAVGSEVMKVFFHKNSWAFDFFPNRGLPYVNEDLKSSSPWFKLLLESFLNNKLGDWLDNYFFKLTSSRWRKKEDEKRLNTKGERMGLKTAKHYSKPNPVFFHDWFMKGYEIKLEEQKKIWNMDKEFYAAVDKTIS